MKNKLYTEALCVLSLTTVLAFAATPAGVNNPPVDADNTALNERDSEGRNLTAQDQASGTDADVETTRLIRRALVAREGLSTNAKNVKIITLKGEVTLRGPVDSEKERSTVASIAKNQVKSQNRVNNYLEINKQ